jgi:hypothetical protein
VRRGPYKVAVPRPLTEAERVRSLAQMDKILKRLINGVVDEVEVEERLLEPCLAVGRVEWQVLTWRGDKVIARRPATPEERTGSLVE